MCWMPNYVHYFKTNIFTNLEKMFDSNSNGWVYGLRAKKLYDGYKNQQSIEYMIKTSAYLFYDWQCFVNLVHQEFDLPFWQWQRHIHNYEMIVLHWLRNVLILDEIKTFFVQ